MTKYEIRDEITNKKENIKLMLSTITKKLKKKEIDEIMSFVVEIVELTKKL